MDDEVNPTYNEDPLSEVTGAAISGAAARKKILIGDDHQVLLDALQTMLRSDFDVETASTGEEFLQKLESFNPDLGMLDVSMPGQNGFVIAEHALAAKPGLPIVFLTMQEGSMYRQFAASVGARAFLSKTLPAPELVERLNEILEGRNLLVPAEGGETNRDFLTERQCQVLKLIAEGASAKGIANELNISVRTAEFHRAAIMHRLNLHSSAQLTRYAIAAGIA